MTIATVALDSARSYLNDSSGSMWDDSKLIPHLQEAHRDLQIMLWLNGLPVLKEKSTILSVPSGTITLTLPSDLIEPQWLKERASGSSEAWVAVTESDWEPDTLQQISLQYWTWREEEIKFLGATSNREVLLRYWKGITVPANQNSVLGFIFSEVFLGPQTAQYAARSVGNSTLANECLDAAKQKLDIIIRANVKSMQSMAARRIPYRRFGRRKLLF